MGSRKATPKVYPRARGGAGSRTRRATAPKRQAWRSDRGLLALDWLLDDLSRVPQLLDDDSVDAYLRLTEVRLAEREGDMPLPMTSANLTEEEILLLQVFSLGTPTGKLAELLGKNKETVITHLGKIRDKMGVPTTGHAACEALRLGLIH